MPLNKNTHCCSMKVCSGKNDYIYRYLYCLHLRLCSRFLFLLVTFVSIMFQHIKSYSLYKTILKMTCLNVWCKNVSSSNYSVMLYNDIIIGEKIFVSYSPPTWPFFYFPHFVKFIVDYSILNNVRVEFDLLQFCT